LCVICPLFSIPSSFILITLLQSLFLNPTATTHIYTLSLHDALPISSSPRKIASQNCQAKKTRKKDLLPHGDGAPEAARVTSRPSDRKSTRLNSSHVKISYAVFCLKKKKKKRQDNISDQNRIGNK